MHRYDVGDGGDDDDGDDDDDDDNGDDDNQLIYTESSIPRVMTGSLKFQEPFVCCCINKDCLLQNIFRAKF